MPISTKMKEDLYDRADGRCECTMKLCTHHTGRCNAMLRGAWEAHRISAGGLYILSNLEAMCQTCHRNTPSYGRGRLAGLISVERI